MSCLVVPLVQSGGGCTLLTTGLLVEIAGRVRAGELQSFFFVGTEESEPYYFRYKM